MFFGLLDLSHLHLSMRHHYFFKKIKGYIKYIAAPEIYTLDHIESHPNASKKKRNLNSDLRSNVDQRGHVAIQLFFYQLRFLMGNYFVRNALA